MLAAPSPWILPTALTLVSGVATLAVSMAPPGSGPLAAVFPPWWTAAHSLIAAGTAGPVVRFGTLPFVVVVAPADTGAAARLHQAGAWLLLDPLALGGCAGPRRPERKSL